MMQAKSCQRGALTLDFLFAFVLVMAFSTILFALALTLTVAEVTQYITYASARNYYAAHASPDKQEALAKKKYMELVSHKEFRPFYVNGWFEVEAEPYVGDMTQIEPGYQQDGGDPNKFWGVGTTFIARMLEFNVPFYGPTAAQGDGSGRGFKTFLASYLGREVSTLECQSFMAARWQNMRSLQVSSGSAPYSTAPDKGDKGYVSYEDNGC